MRIDPSREVPLPLILGGLGAIIGGVQGGASAIANGGRFRDFLSGPATGAFFGGVSGLTLGTGASAPARIRGGVFVRQTLAGAAAGTAGESSGSLIATGDLPSVDRVGVAAMVGGVAGQAGIIASAIGVRPTTVMGNTALVEFLGSVFVTNTDQYHR